MKKIGFFGMIGTVVLLMFVLFIRSYHLYLEDFCLSDYNKKYKFVRLLGGYKHEQPNCNDGNNSGDDEN